MSAPYRTTALGVAALAAVAGLTLPAAAQTTTPIKHLVVIFGENISFDHYFGTYPSALYPQGQAVSSSFPAGETAFKPLANSPTINGVLQQAPGSLAVESASAIPPFRLDRSNAVTCDNDNAYKDEQTAYAHGLVSLFAQTTSGTGTNTTTHAPCDQNLSMGYYDGNTVTAMWNYAQHFAISDNFFDTEFGTTVMGHLNLISGQTHVNVTGDPSKEPTAVAGAIQNGTIIANVSSALDDCPSSGEAKVTMTSKNVGDLLNAKGISWGWFYGDVTPNTTPGTKATCTGYNNHYDPFQYYASTANPHHLAPSSPAVIGTSADQANHQYGLAAFNTALQAQGGATLPAVTFIKAPSASTGHPQKSDPLSEQTFLVNTINALMQSPYWQDMAIILTYDDSDGWYDHVMPPIVNQSADATVDSICGSLPLATGAYNDRCGYGSRLPLVVISPFAKNNYVDHAVTDLTSVLRFIEDNWSLGRIDGATPPPAGQASFDQIAGSLAGLFDFAAPANLKKLTLNPTTGAVVSYQ
ncbi:MAG: alkaline phosphatase family protein [Alphaproteobacteria bacterium]|nr:alkaline phosphatase family protein [Alphaproteobacteria bacterium]